MILRRFLTIPDLKSGDNMQKFYKFASIARVDTGFQILLDGRSIRTPEKQHFIVPTEALGISIASEWQSQDKFILQHRMPLVLFIQVNLASSGIDLPVTQLRPILINRLLNFLKNDTVW